MSVLDRGFIFGDGVYEVIPVFSGGLFRLDQHLQRLHGSLNAVRIRPPLSDHEWVSLLTTLVARNGEGDQSVYVQVTRGVARRDHVLTDPVMATVFAMSTPLDTGRSALPVTAITCEDIRWRFCHIKSISLLANVLFRQQAAEAGAYEAILIRNGSVTEGAASNVFVVSRGVIKTPPKGQALLAGITRDLIVELLAAHRIPHGEVELPETELKEAEEIWLTSSVREILPVVDLDGRPVGTGQPGPRWKRVSDLYQDFKARSIDACGEAAAVGGVPRM